MKLREILPIRLQDIRLDYNPAVIHVVNGARGSTRCIQINPTWCPNFREYIEKLKQLRPSDAFLFPGRMPGRPNDRGTAIVWWKKALKESGLRRIPLEKGTHGIFGIWQSKRLPPQGLIN
jgi:integrase